ncbi:MAG TPA: FlgD immunoglobulin-like domain containing protein [Bacteroidota bacterium]
MKNLLLINLVFAIASSSVVAQTFWRCQLQTNQPARVTINPVEPLVVIYVDFPDGRLADGNSPVQDSDLDHVQNLDGVGSMGYTRPLGNKKVRKYVYEDYWNMLFSSNVYSGANVHPDFGTYQNYTPPEGGGPYDLTVYGSVRDYWDEVSYGNLQIQAYPTRSGGEDMYHTGIVNKIDVVNGRNCIRWITLDHVKSAYGLGDPYLDPISAAINRVVALHRLPPSDPDYIEFDENTYPSDGKIAVVTAGGALGGWTRLGGQGFVMPEKLSYLRNTSSSVVLDGITGLAHEFGHTIGFAHQAVGSWDIMHWGGFGDRRYYFCPPHLNARAKLQAGWLSGRDVLKISSTADFVLEPVTSARSPKVAIVTIYGDAGRSGKCNSACPSPWYDWKHSEYFILEYRKREKFNRFAGGPGAPPGFDGGVLIWHSSNYGDFSSSFNDNDVVNSGIDLTLGPLVLNYGSSFKADTGDPSQLYHSGHNLVNPSSTPNTNSINNYPTGISLSNFSAADGQVSVSAVYASGSVRSYDQFYSSYFQGPLPEALTGNVFVEGQMYSLIPTTVSGAQIDISPGCNLMFGPLTALQTAVRLIENGSLSLYKEMNISGTFSVTGTGKVSLRRANAVTLGNGGTVDIGTGSTLSIGPGAVFRGGSGSMVRINGQILAEGTPSRPIVFDRTGSSGSWNGLTLNDGSSGTLTSCNFNNAAFGITCHSSSTSISNCGFNGNGVGMYCISCSPSITGNDIENSSLCGIYLSGASPSLQSNRISNNTSSPVYGVYCYNYSSPFMADNIITGAQPVGVGLFCYYYSHPTLGGVPAGNVISLNGGYAVDIKAVDYSSVDLGYDMRGNAGAANSIRGNPRYYVYASDGCSVTAPGNWWGGYPADSTRFCANQNSVIDYSNGLTYDPSPEKPGVQAPGPIRPRHPSGLHSDSTFIPAGHYGPAGNYDDSIALYLKVYNATPKTSLLAKQSLLRLSETYERSGKAAFIDLLHTLIAPTIPLKSELSVIARELEAHWLTRAGRYEDAIAMFQALHADYPGNPGVDKFALFNIGEIYQVCLNNHLKTVESLTHFRSKYPYDPLAPVAGLLISSTAGPLASSPQVRGGTATSGGPGPAAFELEPNYPNPFNPSTRIGYSLSESVNVSLVIYDVLGREIATLADAHQQAGRYTVTWNSTQGSGVRVSSGVYFARLRVTDDLGMVKFTKTSRLLLMK